MVESLGDLVCLTLGNGQLNDVERSFAYSDGTIEIFIKIVGESPRASIYLLHGCNIEEIKSPVKRYVVIQLGKHQSSHCISSSRNHYRNYGRKSAKRPNKPNKDFFG